MGEVFYMSKYTYIDLENKQTNKQKTQDKLETGKPKLLIAIVPGPN